MSDHNETVAAPVVKAVSAWAAVGIASWSDLQAAAGAVAATLAAFYSLLLIFEWWWKKVWRPMLEARGVLKRKRRRREDYESETGSL